MEWAVVRDAPDAAVQGAGLRRLRSMEPGRFPRSPGPPAPGLEPGEVRVTQEAGPGRAAAGPPHAEDDRRLVERCLAREPEACAEFVARLRKRVFTLILRMVPAPEDAEDLAQETFLKAFRALDSYDPSYPLVTWVFKIAHNTCVDFLRVRGPETVALDDPEEPLDPPDPAPPPEAVVEARDREAALDGVFGEMAPLYREVLLLRHQEGMDYAGMASVLGLPEGTVKIRLFRARRLLRNLMVSRGLAP